MARRSSFVRQETYALWNWPPTRESSASMNFVVAVFPTASRPVEETVVGRLAARDRPESSFENILFTLTADYVWNVIVTKDLRSLNHVLKAISGLQEKASQPW